jgi:hypothetical protein
MYAVPNGDSISSRTLVNRLLPKALTFFTSCCICLKNQNFNEDGKKNIDLLASVWPVAIKIKNKTIEQ